MHGVGRVKDKVLPVKSLAVSDNDRILHFCTGKPLILHTRNTDLIAAIFIVFDFYSFWNDILLVRSIKTKKDPLAKLVQVWGLILQ